MSNEHVDKASYSMITWKLGTSLPSKSAVSINNSKRIKRCIHYLPGRK